MSAGGRAAVDRGAGDDHLVSPAVLEEDSDDLYDNAPCGYLSTLLDGTIAKVNATLLNWLGYTRADLIGRRRLLDLLTAGAQIFYETHCLPLLRMQDEVSGVTLDLSAADGSRLPVLITSVIKRDSAGQPTLIRTTLVDARDRRSYEQELQRARRQAEHERERLRLLVAGLQRSLLPATLPAPPGMQSATHYHMASADEVGGDFYDLFPLRDGRWAFFLGDVCGKGIAAAAVTAAARYTLRAAAVYDPDPVAVLRNLNEVLYQDYGSEAHRHCTVTFGILTPDEAGNTASLAGGGHPPALLLRADGSAEYQPTTGGALIGIMPDPPLAARTVRLVPGDTLILYSDGLTEARVTDEPDSRYSSDALLAFARELTPTTAPAAVEALTALLATFERATDDVAIMALGMTMPEPGPATA